MLKNLFSFGGKEVAEGDLEILEQAFGAFNRKELRHFYAQQCERDLGKTVERLSAVYNDVESVKCSIRDQEVKALNTRLQESETHIEMLLKEDDMHQKKNEQLALDLETRGEELKDSHSEIERLTAIIAKRDEMISSLKEQKNSDYSTPRRGKKRSLEEFSSPSASASSSQSSVGWLDRMFGTRVAKCEFCLHPKQLRCINCDNQKVLPLLPPPPPDFSNADWLKDEDSEMEDEVTIIIKQRDAKKQRTDHEEIVLPPHTPKAPSAPPELFMETC